MREARLAFAVLCAACSLGCRPDVGAAISLVTGPSVLAMKGQPAEAAPGTEVSYEVLAADLGGRVPSPTGDITSPLLWALCDQPKPPVETNSVSSACLDTSALPGAPGPTPMTYLAAMPDTACQEFGPLPNQSDPPIRPRDPDVTGGYYLPVRVSMEIPEALRRPGTTTPDSLMSFGLERISCGIANVPSAIAREFTKNYTLNTNPTIAALTWQTDAAAATEATSLEAGGAAIQVGSGQTVTFVLSWTPDSVEHYPAYDVLNRVLVYHPESMRVAWYATGGHFEHDVSGRTESEADSYTFAENTWKSDSPGVVHMWVALHDARGGVDFASYDIEVR